MLFNSAEYTGEETICKMFEYALIKHLQVIILSTVSNCTCLWCQMLMQQNAEITYILLTATVAINNRLQFAV